MIRHDERGNRLFLIEFAKTTLFCVVETVLFDRNGILLRSRYENSTPKFYWVFCTLLDVRCICIDTHLPRYEEIAYVLPHFDSLTHMVIHVSSTFIFAICFRKAYISICVCREFVESSKAFKTLIKISLWIKPSYFQYGSSLSLENVCDYWCMHQ